MKWYYVFQVHMKKGRKRKRERENRESVKKDFPRGKSFFSYMTANANFELLPLTIHTFI